MSDDFKKVIVTLAVAIILGAGSAYVTFRILEHRVAALEHHNEAQRVRITGMNNSMDRRVHKLELEKAFRDGFKAGQAQVKAKTND